jgi:hypothetical protein
MPNYILSNTASEINTVLSQANTNINRNLFDFGKIGSASVRSEFFIDYIHYNCTGSYSLPANWNSLRF